MKSSKERVEGRAALRFQQRAYSRGGTIQPRNNLYTESTDRCLFPSHQQQDFLRRQKTLLWFITVDGLTTSRRAVPSITHLSKTGEQLIARPTVPRQMNTRRIEITRNSKIIGQKQLILTERLQVPKLKQIEQINGHYCPRKSHRLSQGGCLVLSIGIQFDLSSSEN